MKGIIEMPESDFLPIKTIDGKAQVKESGETPQLTAGAGFLAGWTWLAVSFAS